MLGYRFMLGYGERRTRRSVMPHVARSAAVGYSGKTDVDAVPGRALARRASIRFAVELGEPHYGGCVHERFRNLT